VVAVALALAIAALVVAGTVVLRAPAPGDDARLRAAALDAARAAAVSLTSYDHRSLDEDFARVSEQATGMFKQEYAQTTTQLRSSLEQSQAVATSTVPAAGLEQLETDPVRAVVVLAVDQTIAADGTPRRTEFNRIRMTLVRPGESWLIAEVERL